MLTGVLVLSIAIIIDRYFGEVSRFHPLVGFGNLANQIESRFNKKMLCGRSRVQTLKRLYGFFAWNIVVLPLPVSYYLASTSLPSEAISNWLFILLDIIVVYFAIGLNSLKQHALNIAEPLANKNITAARQAVSLIVSRETQSMDDKAIARATVESVLENGHDAVLASLFWYAVGGAPLVILHRLANTLDAMWGYKSERFIHFGWFAAKADDWLGWPSAKITGAFYLLAKPRRLINITRIIRRSLMQSRRYKSLNGGWVMAMGANVLKIKLGGVAVYHGQSTESVVLGQAEPAATTDINRSLSLVERASILFVYVLMLISVSIWFIFPGF
ncbi:adenosylcobinamide-phosphate synthase CbiB [Aliikangiella coralliicola]|uniref:Cobalamin biosynthesis protein CobD n=1 Tax=Aliikangiella coralliicola TaxID=2592383 RepID=A0A545UJI4_9GAMM|nr:adenosylcobinamide-phosphate synthase CbiB [Aliikangiella coralliicola]TQV89626.1 cobalamin biosynthesis protein CobD [Aliikangiella coralliicola]